MTVFISKKEIILLNNIINEALHGSSMNTNINISLFEKKCLFEKINNHDPQQDLMMHITKRELIIIQKCIELTLRYIDLEDCETHLGGSMDDIQNIKNKFEYVS